MCPNPLSICPIALFFTSHTLVSFPYVYINSRMALISKEEQARCLLPSACQGAGVKGYELHLKSLIYTGERELETQPSSNAPQQLPYTPPDQQGHSSYSPLTCPVKLSPPYQWLSQRWTPTFQVLLSFLALKLLCRSAPEVLGLPKTYRSGIKWKAVRGELSNCGFLLCICIISIVLSINTEL